MLSTILTTMLPMRAFLILALALAAGAAHAAPPIPADSFSLDNYPGKVVYLDFWASWCVPCRLSFPWMKDMQERYGARGLQVIAVNLDSDAQAATGFLAQFNPDFPVVLDPEGVLAERFDVSGMPNSFLIDRNGRVVRRHEGFRRADAGDLETLLVTELDARP